MIYRLTDEADWQRAQIDGAFASADLASEGFIHCSAFEQILRTANKYYPAHTHLLLLHIEEPLLGDALVREDLTGSGVFPHVYAAIPLAAVVVVSVLARDQNDLWELPHFG